MKSAKTVQGQTVEISYSHGRGIVQTGVKVNDANVTKTDIVADNGVIHVIDKALLPK